MLENAAAAAEAAAQEITREAGDLGTQVEVLQRRSIISREVGRLAKALYEWRGATPGVAHGGKRDVAVVEADARLAIQVAAGFIAYIAARSKALTETSRADKRERE